MPVLETLLIVSGLLNAGLIALKVVAPRTKTPLDDKVLTVLDKYGVPLVEYLQALYGPVVDKTLSDNKVGNEPRPQARDHRTGK